MAHEVTEYTVRYDRDERGWWFGRVQGLPGCHTQGRSIAQARKRIREALGLFVDDAESATLIDDVVLPAKLRRLASRGRSMGDKARALDAAASATFRELVSRLVNDAGFSLRDVSDVTGLTHQRIHQIVADPRHCARTAPGRSAGRGSRPTRARDRAAAAIR